MAACPATPTQLIDFNALARQLGAGGISATQLAVDTTGVYFVYGSELLSMPLEGGSVSTLLNFAPLVGQYGDPTATSTAVLLHLDTGTGTSEEILSVPKAGGRAHTLATTSGRVLCLEPHPDAVGVRDRRQVPLG